MPNETYGRGTTRLAEATANAGSTVPERLHAILRRIEGQTGDTPVAVSAAFLRSVAQYLDDVAASTSTNVEMINSRHAAGA